MGTSVELDVANPSGLHARPAATFVRTAGGFRCDVRVANLTTGSPEVTAKSIIAVLGLGVERGHRIRIRVEGEDESVAATTLAELVASGLGEAIGDAAGPAGS
jgi:phosphotransferase system HPr (HPr) family protein